MIACRKLVTEAVVLKKMSARSTWVEVLENQEDKKIIEQSFKRIDEYTKDFHVRSLGQPRRNESGYLFLVARHRHGH